MRSDHNDFEKKINNAFQALDEEISNSLKQSRWPEYCGMLGDPQRAIQIDESIQSSLTIPYRCAACIIELSYDELINSK